MMIRCRLDGKMEGVYGPLTLAIDHQGLAGVMCWEYSGGAIGVIDTAMDHLRRGQAAKLRSRAGVTTFQPLLPDEDGALIPASASRVIDLSSR